MRELTIKEMEITSGAFGPPGAIIGGAMAAGGYIGHSVVTGSGDVKGLIGSIALGAATGFFTSPVGVTAMETGAAAIGATHFGFYAGLFGGMVERGVDAAGTNYNEAGTNYN